MRDFYTLPRLYVTDPLEREVDIILSEQHHHYLGRVLRRNIGDQVRLFNGSDGEWVADITQMTKRKTSLVVGEQIRTLDPPPDIWLLFAPLKPKRNVFIVEKATELGAALIQPVITVRTTSRINMDKMRSHVIEAAEQTERLDLPYMMDTQKLEHILADWDESRALIFADEAGGAKPAAITLAKIKTPAAILIGPEGGFAAEEREMLRAKSYVTPISLGPRILRADTAAVATLALWQAVSGDW